MKGARWSKEDDAVLSSLHGSGMTIAEIAEEVGRTHAAVRARVTRLGLAKRQMWSNEDVSILIEAYERAGPDGILDLDGLARTLGRHKANVCRKARELGLPTNQRRRVVEFRKDKQRKYETDDEVWAASSRRMKEWHRKNEHPRGMLGRKHSKETKRRLSASSKAAWLSMSPKEREDQATKAARARAKSGHAPPNTKRGSWAAGWREIGGKRNYYRSRWEANYARYLQWLKEMNQIKDWEHEPETFWFEAIRRGVRSYKPDFRVWENDGSSRLHEVKGWMDSRSRTTLRRMAKYHPEETIILIDTKAYRKLRRQVMGLVPGWEDSDRDRRI